MKSQASLASVAVRALLLERIDEENDYQRGKREGFERSSVRLTNEEVRLRSEDDDREMRRMVSGP
jgi:hypothetical protein